MCVARRFHNKQVSLFLSTRIVVNMLKMKNYIECGFLATVIFGFKIQNFQFKILSDQRNDEKRTTAIYVP